MVEGPGCTSNGERLRKSGVISQLVLAVLGAASSAELDKAIRGLQIHAVETLGKELFVFMAPVETEGDGSPGERCLRVHFGMNGSLHVNSTHRFAAAPCLQLQLARCTSTAPTDTLQLSRDTIVRLYQSTVSLRPAQAMRKHIEKLRKQDVCGPFDAQAAAAALLAHGSGRERLLVDALLDQVEPCAADTHMIAYSDILKFCRPSFLAAATCRIAG